MSSPTYLLIGSGTGRQGGAVINALFSNPDLDIKAKNAWAITRNMSGPSAQRLKSNWLSINILVGDLNDPDALFGQLDPLIPPRTEIFLAQSYGPTELSSAKSFIDAASSHGIPYFVYCSVDRGGRTLSETDPSYCKTFSDRFCIKHYLKSVAGKGKSVEHIIIRPTWFVDNVHWGFVGKFGMIGRRGWMEGKRM